METTFSGIGYAVTELFAAILVAGLILMCLDFPFRMIRQKK
jgi:hypothetical protein